jgi:hypothetical protein
VLAFCRAELLQQNYLHAVLPQVRFNALATEWERSEQTGIATLMKGLFNTFRNPAAHAPRVAWATSCSDALDMLTLASMLHRRLDKADVRQTVPDLLEDGPGLGW